MVQLFQILFNQISLEKVLREIKEAVDQHWTNQTPDCVCLERLVPRSDRLDGLIHQQLLALRDDSVRVALDDRKGGF